MEDMVTKGQTDWRGRRVFVTGHTGFKGSWLTLKLAQMGAEVFGYAKEPTTRPALFTQANLASDCAAHTIGDICDRDALEAAMNSADPEVVFHLAAQALVRESYRDPLETIATNVLGTASVLDVARRLPSLRAVVVVTSDKCYENREWEWGYRETDSLGGHDPYSASKACAELVARSFARAFDTNGAIVTARAGNVIGGGDWANDRLVPDAMRAFQAGEPLMIRNPQATRPWQHVLEPLTGYVQLAEHAMAQTELGAQDWAWNFGPAVEANVSVESVVNQVQRLWGGEASWSLQAGYQPHEAASLYLDSSKAIRRLGWQRKLTLGDSLDWTTRWYQKYYAGQDARQLMLSDVHAYREAGGVSDAPSQGTP